MIRRIRGLLHQVASLTRQPTFINAGFLLIGFAARMGFQMSAYILLARTLGAVDFGAFATLLAVANIIAPLVEYGAFNLVVRDIVNGVPARNAIGIGVGFALFTIPVGVLVLVVIKVLLLPQIALWMVMAVGLGVFIGNRSVQLVNGANLASGQPWRNTVLESLNGASLLLMVAALLWINGGLSQWCWLFLLQGIALGLFTLTWATRLWGTPTWVVSDLKKRVQAGSHFAINGVTTWAFTDLDKALLARLSTLDTVGIYTAAQRFIALAAMPLAALLHAIYPQFFAMGQKGLPEVERLAKKVLPITLGYAIVASGILWMIAPYVPLLLGETFSQTTEAIRWLCGFVILQGLQIPFAESLTGSGFQVVRTSMQIVALSANLLLNLMLIPEYGWRGAAIASLISQFIFVNLLIWQCNRIRLASVKGGLA